MKLTDAQWGVLYSLESSGPSAGIETLMPPDMGGNRRVKLSWNMGTTATLVTLETLGLVRVQRQPHTQPRDATGRPGNPRRAVTISINDAGLAAIAADRARAQNGRGRDG